LALNSALVKETDLLRPVVPLLRAPEAKVRWAALSALGLAKQVLADEELLPLLHDDDANVRRLCEQALDARGLTPEHIQLGRLFSAPRAVARLDVFDYLRETADLEPGVWLRRLSQDRESAVRAAAARAAGEVAVVDLSDRLRQMSR